MNKTCELPIPPHFRRDSVGEVRRVPYQQMAEEAREWARIHDLRPASEDDFRTCLVAVDCQNTFCIPGFELFVSGRSGMAAVEDNVRLCEFVYRNLDRITEILVTMDTHTIYQIFHGGFWVNERGENPAPFTAITVSDILNGVLRVNPAISQRLSGMDYDELAGYARHYVKELADKGKYELTVWPYHAMLGGIGHALVSSVEEAVFFHGIARSSQPGFEIKGSHILTEHYSALSPEVLTDHGGRSIADKNLKLAEHLAGFDAVIIAGQAKSHCVAWTVENLLEETAEPRAMRADKVYLLEDCTSPVVVPGVADFTDQADAAYRRFADAGMHVVKSTDPIAAWPGIAER